MLETDNFSPRTRKKSINKIENYGCLVGDKKL